MKIQWTHVHTIPAHLLAVSAETLKYTERWELTCCLSSRNCSILADQGEDSAVLENLRLPHYAVPSYIFL